MKEISQKIVAAESTIYLSLQGGKMFLFLAHIDNFNIHKFCILFKPKKSNLVTNSAKIFFKPPHTAVFRSNHLSLAFLLEMKSVGTVH